ncbi:Acyltransferase [Rhodanobacter sp. Root179]|uniref:acyltransferase family protein n=1 Tax=unclassified Rhodanobacter TaxID=2621553 RepID=UPI0006F6FA5B|nr:MULTISPECIES: acyltransferase [unclassified Rhodanobacter]KQZ74613.1 acyltransferase [Rhodanobacter sp. Root561]KRB33803.1 acyltransferase [Rhodanobacter sp. Root179]
MRYSPALDGVRALSILAVVSFHCGAPWGRGGYLGVDVFFVLSGYLITSLLMAEHRNGGIRTGAFYARRALRLYPTLLLMVAAYVVVAPVLWPNEHRWLLAAFASFYVMDYALVLGQATKTIGHTWSLGVEEKFYLLWPLLLPLLLRTRRPLAWLLAAFACITAWRYAAALSWGWLQAYFSFDTRMSGIVLGAMAALAGLHVSRPVALIACAVLAFCVACPIMPSLPHYLPIEAVTLELTLAELSAFLLICHLAEHDNSGFLASRPMVYVGKLSYGIYLWHFPVAVLLNDAYRQPWWITLTATTLFSFAMAALCLQLVDMPIKRWRGRRSHESSRLPSRDREPLPEGFQPLEGDRT